MRRGCPTILAILAAGCSSQLEVVEDTLGARVGVGEDVLPVVIPGTVPAVVCRADGGERAPSTWIFAGSRLVVLCPLGVGFLSIEVAQCRPIVCTDDDDCPRHEHARCVEGRCARESEPWTEVDVIALCLAEVARASPDCAEWDAHLFEAERLAAGPVTRHCPGGGEACTAPIDCAP